MRMILFVVILCVSGFVSASAADQTEKYTAIIMPDNVTLGMALDAVQLARPEAKKLDVSLGSRRTNAIVLTELMKGILPAACYQYHFVDNQMRAVTKGILHAGKRDEQMVKHLHKALAKEFVKQADEKIIRLNENMQQVLVTAELWKDEKDGTCIYFVDTSKDTMIITFDPKYFGKKDFFISPDEMPDITPTLENMRKTIEASKKQKN